MISSYAGPIANNTYCTAEPRGSIYDNVTFNKFAPLKFDSAPKNVPSIDDMQPRTEAGAHTDYCVAYSLTPDMTPTLLTPFGQPGMRTVDPSVPLDPATDPKTGDDQARIVAETPVGFASNVADAATCSDAQFALTTGDTVTGCDAAQVGDVFVRLSADIPAIKPFAGTFHAALPTAASRIFKLEPGPNEVARLGVEINPVVIKASKLLIHVGFSEGSGPKRLLATVDDPPRFTSSTDGLTEIPLYVESVGLRFWGEGGAGSVHPTMAHPFAENGTECGVDERAGIKIDTFGGSRESTVLAPVQSDVQTPAYQLTGCGSLPFGPSIDVTTTERTPGTPTGVTAKLAFAQTSGNANGSALLKDASVSLPAGLELGAQVGSRSEGLGLCSEQDFGFTSNAAAGCAADTRVGTVQIVSPLIDSPFVGDVYVGEQHAVGELPDLYLQAGFAGGTGADAPRIKVIGKTSVNADGQITSTFSANPQLRFSSLELNFSGGDNALFVTPRTCGTTTGESSFVSWAGGPAVQKSSSLVIDQGCDLPTFAPTVTMGVADAQAGASSPTTILIKRGDRQPWLNDVNVALPTGFLADLKVPAECSRAAAATGNCPASSRIGTVKSLAGAGNAPLALDGALYLVEREASYAAGAVIVVRAKIGALDLGDVVVPGKIGLRPTDAGLDFQTAVPARFRGLALNLREVAVTMDREGFPLSPSACGPLAYSASITGDGGQTAAPAGQISYTGCGSLPFQPKLDAKLFGEVKPSGHPGMHVTVKARPGDTNLRAATVLLPEGVAADLRNVQISCAPEAFVAVACPANTRIGSTVARVSITDEAITGDVYLVKVKGETLPGLGLSFNGRFAQRVLSLVKINSQGRLLVRFDQVPDLPLRDLTVDVSGGKSGPLQLSPAECANGTRWDAVFTGQGGQHATDQTGLRCAAIAKVKLAPNRAFSLRIFDFGGRNLQSLKATLPSGYTIDTRAAKRTSNFWARLTGAKARTSFSKKSITIRPDTRQSSTLRFKLDRKALDVSKQGKKAKKLVVKIRYVFTDGAIQNQTITIRQSTNKKKK